MKPFYFFVGVIVFLTIMSSSIFSFGMRIRNIKKHIGINIMDSSFIADYTLINELEAVAKKNRIPHQRTILARGGQDGAAGQQSRTGARAAGIVVGTRYIHTVTEMIDLIDLAAARDLLAAWAKTVK